MAKLKSAWTLGVSQTNVVPYIPAVNIQTHVVGSGSVKNGIWSSPSVVIEVKILRGRGTTRFNSHRQTSYRTICLNNDNRIIKKNIKNTFHVLTNAQVYQYLYHALLVFSKVPKTKCRAQKLVPFLPSRYQEVVLRTYRAIYSLNCNSLCILQCMYSNTFTHRKELCRIPIHRRQWISHSVVQFILYSESCWCEGSIFKKVPQTRIIWELGLKI